MQTALLPDILGQMVHEGDYLIDDSGRAYVADFTENSFILQTIIRVRKVHRLKRGGLGSDTSHSYLQPQFALRIEKDDIPYGRTEIRRMFNNAIKGQVRYRIDRYLREGT